MGDKRRINKSTPEGAKNPERIEHERIRAGILALLISCFMFTAALLLLIAALAFLMTPGPLTAPLLFAQWLDNTSRLSDFLIEEANPVSTALSAATLTTALVLACAFSRKPDKLLMPTELIRLRFLETVTTSTAMFSGATLVVSSPLLIFGGFDAAIAASTSLACGLLTLSLGVMVPVSSQYWARAIEDEEHKLKKLREVRRRNSQTATGLSTWLRATSTNALLRTTWLLITSALIAAEYNAQLNWTQVARFAIPVTIAVGLAWDLSTMWSRLYLSTMRLTEPWTALLISLIWAGIFILLALSSVQLSLQTTWLFGLFLAGTFAMPFITSVVPHLNRDWRWLHAARFEREIQNALQQRMRYESLHQLTQAEQDISPVTDPRRQSLSINESPRRVQCQQCGHRTDRPWFFGWRRGRGSR